MPSYKKLVHFDFFFVNWASIFLNGSVYKIKTCDRCIEIVENWWTCCQNEDCCCKNDKTIRNRKNIAHGLHTLDKVATKGTSFASHYLKRKRRKLFYSFFLTPSISVSQLASRDLGNRSWKIFAKNMKDCIIGSIKEYFVKKLKSTQMCIFWTLSDLLCRKV